jgi:hypothetical protein
MNPPMAGVSVRVEEDLTVGRELEGRWRTGPAQWPVPVTDLLDPRSAFFRRFAPVPLPPERRRRRARGSSLHARWVRHLGPPERVEAWVQREGIVGVIDLLEPDGPTELKTTRWVPPMDRWASERGAYLDQLGLYAGLTGLPQGRLVVVSETETGERGAPLVARCSFQDPAEILREGALRAERFRRAMRSRSPTELPRCAWFGRRCPYQDAHACDCTGGEPADDAWVRGGLRSVEEDTEAEGRWVAAMHTADQDPHPVLRSFGELVYPRRAYFDRIDPAGPAEGSPIDPESQAAYRDLAAAVDGGPPGERSQRSLPTGDPPGSVPLFRGLPFLTKTTKAAQIPEPYPSGLFPSHYRDELAFRSAALGVTEGWVFLDAMRARPPGRRIRALRVHFDDPSAWVQELARRRAALSEALTRHDPTSLPACPSWRAESCPYRTECGCAGPTTPS